MPRLIPTSIASVLASAMILISGSVLAQTFASPNCSSVSADSTCFTAGTPSTCSLAAQPASQVGACPAGYSGTMDNSGMRNMCTGTVTWNAPPANSPGCTNCPSTLTQGESQAMMAATLEESEPANLGMSSYIYPSYSYKDGAVATNPLTGLAIGHMFRDHIWVAPDGYSSGQLPTTNRVNYLLAQNEIPSNIPPSPLLPKDPNGNPITNSGKLYLLALNAAESSGATSCSGDGMNGCHISCSQPSAGWMEPFCHVKTVEFLSCADSYAVSNGGGWTPTASVTLPYTDHGNYSNKTWDWQSDFGFNGLSNSGGNVYLCSETINSCSGWQTTNSVYQCRIPATYDCSYTVTSPLPPYTVTTVPQTCSTCDQAMGAYWDYYLTQSNDCPLVPGSSSRAYAGQPRNIWQSDLPSCSVSGPPAPSCTSNQIVLPGGSCGCATGLTWDGSMCSAPPPPSSPTLPAALAFTFNEYSPLGAVLQTSPTSISGGENASNTPRGEALNMLNVTNQTFVNRYLQITPTGGTAPYTYVWTITAIDGPQTDFSFGLAGSGPKGDWTATGWTSPGYDYNGGSENKPFVRSDGTGEGYARTARVTVTVTDAVGATGTASVVVSNFNTWEVIPGGGPAH